MGKCCTRFRSRIGAHPVQVLSIINGSILTACVSLGLGKHPFVVDPDQLSYLQKLYLISLPFASLTLSLPPIAVAILLDRLIEPKRPLKWVLYSVPALQVIVTAVDIVLIFVQCSPTSALWYREGTRAECWNSRVIISYVYFVSSICSSKSCSVQCSSFGRLHGFHGCFPGRCANGGFLEVATDAESQDCPLRSDG